MQRAPHAATMYWMVSVRGPRRRRRCSAGSSGLPPPIPRGCDGPGRASGRRRGRCGRRRRTARTRCRRGRRTGSTTRICEPLSYCDVLSRERAAARAAASDRASRRARPSSDDSGPVSMRSTAPDGRSRRRTPLGVLRASVEVGRVRGGIVIQPTVHDTARGIREPAPAGAPARPGPPSRPLTCNDRPPARGRLGAHHGLPGPRVARDRSRPSGCATTGTRRPRRCRGARSMKAPDGRRCRIPSSTPPSAATRLRRLPVPRSSRPSRRRRSTSALTGAGGVHSRLTVVGGPGSSSRCAPTRGCSRFHVKCRAC